jgi:putative transposase
LAEKNLVSNSTVEARKSMAEPGNKRISLSHQAELLSINRTSIYRPPGGTEWTEVDLEDMRMIDEIS